jgi:predicted RNA binding protein YcfA (HicA-like mRNA interferase family)
MKQGTLPIIIQADADGYFVSRPALQGAAARVTPTRKRLKQRRHPLTYRVLAFGRRGNSRERLRKPFHCRSRCLMPRLPRLTAREISGALPQNSFSLARQSRSHTVYKTRAPGVVTVPFHAAKTLHPKVLRSILRDADLSIEKLEELLSLCRQDTRLSKLRARCSSRNSQSVSFFHGGGAFLTAVAINHG